MHARVLDKSQAEAIYSAMCALNNIGATIRASIPPSEDGGHWTYLEKCADSGQITLTTGLRRVACHSDQAAFASAYGLQTEGQKRRQERRERDEQYLMYGVEETRTGSRA